MQRRPSVLFHLRCSFKIPSLGCSSFEISPFLVRDYGVLHPKLRCPSSKIQLSLIQDSAIPHPRLSFLLLWDSLIWHSVFPLPRFLCPSSTTLSFLIWHSLLPLWASRVRHRRLPRTARRTPSSRSTRRRAATCSCRRRPPARATTSWWSRRRRRSRRVRGPFCAPRRSKLATTCSATTEPSRWWRGKYGGGGGWNLYFTEFLNWIARPSPKYFGNPGCQSVSADM